MVAAGVCSNLDRTRFDPVVLFMDKSTGPMPEILTRLSVPFDGFDMTRLSRPLRPLIVAWVLNRLKIDVLHVHHLPFYTRTAFGARLAGVKGVVFTEHSKHELSQSQRLQNDCRKAARTAAHFTVVSAELKAFFVNELGIPDESVRVIKNGVDTKRFRPLAGGAERPRVLPSSGKGHTLISVGRLHEAKDHVTLLRAIKRLVMKNVQISLVLVGEGELRGLVENTVNELGLQAHVHLLGNWTNVEDLLPHADLFVLSSRHEGLPMVLLEAMSCGLPIVTTAVGGIPEIVEDGVNGYLVPRENPDSLAEKIELLLAQPETARRMGATNRDQAVAKYSMLHTAGCYAQLYDDIMAGRPQAKP